MPKVKRNHASSRLLVCLICHCKFFRNGRTLMNKTNLTTIIREKYELFCNYDPLDMTFPNAVCSTCARALYSCNNNEGGTLPIAKACAYINTKPTLPHTRTCSNASPCDICQIAGQKYKQSKPEPCQCPKCKEFHCQEPRVENQVRNSVIPHLFTASDLLNIQAEQNSSNTQSLKLAKSLRSVLGRSAIEPGFKGKLEEASRKAEDFYSYSILSFEISEKIGYEDRVLTHCNDIEALVNYVVKVRNYDPFNHIVRIGLDGGGGMFKVVMNIINTTDPRPTGFFQDTGVRKTIILAAVEKIKETHQNIHLILSKLNNVDRVKFFICSDIKLINIISGIQSCSAKHPCPYCETGNLVESNENIEHRTIGSVRCSAVAYKDAGSILINAKNYKNCINEPLLPGDANERILDICAPPELHLMQGITKHIFDKMNGEWSDVYLWLKGINVNQKNYHHGSFVGNDCMKMLKNLDLLQQLAPSHIQKYVHIHRCLYKIVNSCFGMELDPEYEKYIKDFKELYLTLRISVTPKVHILIEHVPDFCKKHVRSLGWYSEQALESCHHDFLRNCWEKQSYKRTIGHPDYAKNLTAAVTAYSSKHI